MTGLRVLVVDDHPLYREGLVGVLEAMESVGAVAEAGSGPEAIDVVARDRPDLVLMDVQMPGMNGIDATREILTRAPDTVVVMLTMVEDDEVIVAALQTGARGYLVKGSNRAQIQRAVEAAAEGHLVVAPTVAARVSARLGRPGPVDPFPELTAREREVLELLAQGLTNAAISARLHLSDKTVRNYVSLLFTKLHVSDRGAAIARARDAGIGRAGSRFPP